MDFSEPPRSPSRDSIVPMINIVFLLLIFFLLTATLRPASPFAVEPPESRSPAELGEAPILFVAADGRLAWEDLRGEAVYELIAAAAAEGPLRPHLRADRALPGPAVARILARLGALGVAEVRLVVGTR